MAQRQGLLVGMSLSVVQFKATVMLEWMEKLDRRDGDMHKLKRSLISSGNWRPEAFYPDHFPAEKSVENPPSLDMTTGEGGKAAVDYSAVEWKFASDAEDEYKKLMSELGRLSTGSITGDQMAARGPNEGWR